MSRSVETEKLSIIADYEDRCGECPVWDGDTSYLYWTDIAGCRFYRYHLPSRQHRVISSDFSINGFRLDKHGGFVITNSEGIWSWDGSSQPELINDHLDGIKLRLNDCIADPAGRLFTGSCYYNPHGEYQRGQLIRVDTDGRAVVVDTGFHMPNGLGFSPDCRTLYFTDSLVRRIYAYDYDVLTGEVCNRRIFIQVPREEGLPDGMTVDSEGFIWSAQWYGACVVRYDPAGVVERKIRVPAKQVTSLAFGGDQLTDVFVTTAGESGPLPVMPPGYDPHSGYFGGRLYQFNAGIQGKREYKTDLRKIFCSSSR
ncbi:MAG TPA: SMP-30/gluconolactonase/LRE family protein [Pyrinomonadaceae bacterium]|nr:SMP-30/gluconolactonase/LRE family protein [Pyrinomonadaceae bacterium]